MHILLVVLGTLAVFFSGSFMYLHNGKIWEAITLSAAVLCGLLFLYILQKI